MTALSPAREIDAFNVVHDFEAALCEYAGAPYAVTTTSCTMALLLAVAWHTRNLGHEGGMISSWFERPEIEIPKRTYVSVPMSIIHAGGLPTFRDEDWRGLYKLEPLPVWDCARWFTSRMFEGYAPNDGSWVSFTQSPRMQCLSFHWSKTLGLGQGGAILHDNEEADRWLRQARFDGRLEAVSPAEQQELYGFNVLGFHCYMSPETAAQGLLRLGNLPRHNEPLPNDPYPDLSSMELFKRTTRSAVGSRANRGDMAWPSNSNQSSSRSATVTTPPT